ncbi:hypothetical protein RUM43_010288 [Polyplax serrata]|uniref:CWH43-like N-terminal domain-containing protein n=1 Tax=Polyplax serrata TaxID=468196 RepID=A0AAN8S759_POLSC
MKYLGICFRYLPLILSVFAPVSFFITYGVAVGYDHVTWFWPYISDTGANPPESCIFGLLLNTIAFALSVIVYLRYRYVSDFVKMKPQVKIKRWLNKSATTFGYLSCFGLVIVANFEETSQIIVHVIGAIMAFCFGSLYFGFQENCESSLINNGGETWDNDLRGAVVG